MKTCHITICLTIAIAMAAMVGCSHPAAVSADVDSVLEDVESRRDLILPDNFTEEEALLFEKVFRERMPGKGDMHESSMHYEEGLTCVTCHLDAKIDLEAGTAELAQFTVPIDVCSECHEDEHEGFQKSRHAEALTVFKHVVRYHALNGYPTIQEKGCNTCHEKVGNSCTSCHPGHSFKAPVPPVDDYGGCATCHLGIDHHQLESYQSSVHYQVAQANGNGTPNCVTCHTEDDNLHEIFRIKGTPDHGRAKMMAKCQKCHAEEFAREEFVKIDRVKDETSKILEDARQIIADLYADGVLERISGSLQDEEGRPLLNANMTAYDQHVHPIENIMFRMFKYDAVATISGVQHQSPVRLHWYGHAQLMESYNRVRQMARQLRYQHAVKGKLGIKIKERPAYKYSQETGHELDDIWEKGRAYREELDKYYQDVMHE